MWYIVQILISFSYFFLSSFHSVWLRGCSIPSFLSDILSSFRSSGETICAFDILLLLLLMWTSPTSLQYTSDLKLDGLFFSSWDSQNCELIQLNWGHSMQKRVFILNIDMIKFKVKIFVDWKFNLKKKYCSKIKAAEFGPFDCDFWHWQWSVAVA